MTNLQAPSAELVENSHETIVKLFAKIMFYGDWKWETPNERVIEMLMKNCGYYPFSTEDEMIANTAVDESLFKRALTEVPTRTPIAMLRGNESPSATVHEDTQSIAELCFTVATNADETVEDRITWIKHEMLDTLVARVKNSQHEKRYTREEVIKLMARCRAEKSHLSIAIKVAEHILDQFDKEGK